MRNSRSIIIALLAATTMAACSDTPTAPDELTTSSGSNVPTDTSSSHVTPGKINVSGRVLAISVALGGQNSDTLNFTPMAGIPIRVMHNIMINGQSGQELAANTVSDASGNYHVDNLPAGYYVVYAEPPASSTHNGSYSYVAPTAASVSLNLYLWKKP